jgi:nitroimidazol reductase NimA-like FMN-containing flavoprotein (pyridoxamine 5'-phosphate oxidase superfamily)
MDQKNLAELYHLEPLEWSRVEAELADPDDMQTTFLATTGSDGKSHAAGVGALWVDGTLYFTSGPGTRKSRNLAENPSCSLSMALKGIDVVFEGEAQRVTDEAILQRVAEAYANGGWPATVKDHAFTHEYSAPSAGPPPWYVYEVRPRVAYVVAKEEPNGATRWRFDA